MSAAGVMERVKRRPGSMANSLPSAQSEKRLDNCCGIHGAARRRKGIKGGTSAARRRVDKQLIKEAEDDSISP